MFKYIFPFLFALVLFFCGVFITGNFAWYTWDMFAKFMMCVVWVFGSGTVFLAIDAAGK